MRNTLRSLGLAAIIGSTMLNCSKDEQKPSSAPQEGDLLPEVAKSVEGLEARKKRLAELSKPATAYQPATAVTPSTVVQPGSVTMPATLVPTTPMIPGTSEPAIPTAPVSPGQPNIPSVPTVTNAGKSIFNRPARRTEKKKGSFVHYSVTDPQNFIALGGYGGDNRDSNLSGLDRAGGFALGSLDVRPFDWLRTEAVVSGAEERFKRVGEDFVSNIGIARLGGELVFADNKNFYFGLGPVAGLNYISNKGTVGFEPTDFKAVLAGGKLRTALRGIGLEAYLAGLQSVYGKYENDKFDVEREYFVRELRGGLKQNLGKGISVGAEASDIFQETKALTRFSLRNASGYVELKDILGSPVSAWIIGSGRELDAVDKQRAREVEARVRVLANLGNGFYLGADGAYGRSKIRGSSKTEDNWSVGGLIAYQFK